ncbi:MAG: VCBS repeat-containing protein, partial [Chthoniobacterales bacterium]
DGLKDIVTGKTYWSHHRQSPGWDDGAVVYWFRLVRNADGVDWIPCQADAESGIGRQVVIADVNADRLPDILVGGMKGANVLIHRRQTVDEATWNAAQLQPVAFAEPSEPVTGPAAPIDATTGSVAGAVEGEALVAKVSRGDATSQDMRGFAGGRWSGNAQLFWRGGSTGDILEFPIAVGASGSFVLETVFTRAPDYGIVQLSIDGRAIGEPLDLYHFSKVTTTGVLEHAVGELSAGEHQVSLRITGANAHAAQSRFVGLDYVRLVAQ